MKILHVYKDYYPVLGGIENHVRLLAEAQAQRGHPVSVIVTSLDRHSTVENVAGVRVIKAARLATVASTPLSIALPLALRRECPDIAHLHFPYPVGEVSQLVLGRAPRMILTYHSDVVRQKGLLRFYRPFLWRVLHRADRIIATSAQYIASSPYLSKIAPKCVVIPLGIESQRFLHADQVAVRRIHEQYGAPLVLFVGKLRYYKGLEYLLQAMVNVPARLLVIGTGPMESVWRALASSLGLEDRVSFLGQVSDEDLAAYYHASDVFVLPASERSEAFGTVQIEAMASATPVVSTELGTGTSFVNVHRETGLVVPARDPGALCLALQELLSDRELSQEMGRRARERALREFSLDTMVERVLALYDNRVI